MGKITADTGWGLGWDRISEVVVGVRGLRLSLSWYYGWGQRLGWVMIRVGFKMRVRWDWGEGPDYGRGWG